MLEPLVPELRQELAAARVAALHRSAGHSAAGPLRRAAGSALVRLGLRLGYDGSVPPLVAQNEYSVGARLEPGTHTVSPGARFFQPGTHTVFAAESDLERELAAPFGIRVARLRT